MKKKVGVNDLKPGMYVCELDRPWRETPFLFQGFEITSDEQLATIREHCNFVYIDSDYAKRAEAQTRASLSPRRPRAEADQDARSKPALRVVVEKATAPRPRQVYADRTSLDQEVEVIRETHDQAMSLVYTVMEDVHLRKSIDTATAKRVVASMAKSVLRNPDALICFTHLKKKDDYTALHCLRVSILALVLGRHLGFDEERLNHLGMGALLHDIGKMQVPQEILNKPGKLTEHEFRLMKGHVPFGAGILGRAKGVPSRAVEVARLHHERYGGTGYISNLKGDQISEFGLIGAIVDVYDAITSDRVYQRGISPLDALKKMYEWRTRDFPPMLVEQFIQCIGIFPIGSVVMLNTKEIGVVRTMNRAQRLKPQVVLVLKADRSHYGALRAVDLAQEQTPAGQPYEIAKVLPAGQFGIQPVDYLPVAASA
ncbi:MAG: HD-GYP domain-containing protein [Acidiferrobacterales bacterium]